MTAPGASRAALARLGGASLLVAIVAVLALGGRQAGPFPFAPADGAMASTQARAPAKQGGKLFGMVATPAPPGADGFERMARLGTTIVRVQLNWASIEPKRGARNWSSFDTAVANATAAGLRIVPVLFGVPPWISHDATTPPVRNKFERREWKRFVKDAARRYGAGGIFWTLHPGLPERPIIDWQSGNEPNLPFYFGGKVGVRRYRDLLKITAQALRRVNPGVTVVTAGIFRYETVPGSISMKTFLTRFYRLKGVRRWFDVLGLHPYSPRPKGAIATIKVARRIMRRAHDGRTPVWVTEIGWTTGGVGWRRNAFRATKTQQAKRLKQTYKLLRRHKRLRVRRAFWHSFQDFDYPNRADPWTARMGLLTRSGARKPAWYAYAAVAGGTP